MPYKDFINKVRYWDNLTAKWLMRHFYFMFFQITLVSIFLIWFVNMFHVIDSSYPVAEKGTSTERILSTQSINMTIAVLLMILNSFWMLFIFNSIQRIGNILRDVTYHLSRLRPKGK